MGLLDSAIRILSNSASVLEDDVLLAILVVYRFGAVVFNALDGSICEHALFRPVWIHGLHCSVREAVRLVRMLKKLTLSPSCRPCSAFRFVCSGI